MSYLGPISKNAFPVINYISNGRAIDNTLGWNTYADAAGAQPVDGTGGSPNITWNRDLTSPLRGIADFNFVKDAVNRQGQGVSEDFTIDNADLAKVLTISFDYEILSGTYATGDLAVYLIQDPAGTPVVIQPAGYQIQSASVGTKMKHIATFQTASNVTSYRLCIHVASVSASAYTLAIDNVSVGPQVVQYGAPVTDWVDFPSVAAGTLITATTTNPSYGSVAVNKAQWRRVGGNMEIMWDFRQTTGGGAGSGTYLFNLPPGYSIDSNKVTISASNDDSKSLGVFDYLETTVGTSGIGYCVAHSSTQLRMKMQAIGTGTSAGTIGSAYGALNSSNLSYSLKAKIPILGWSSTVQMSNDTDTRVVAARYYQEANTAQSTYLDFPTKQLDTHNAVTTGSGVWKFTCPVPGFYKVSCRYSGAASAIIRLYKNGSLFPASNAAIILDANPTNGNGSGSTLVELVAGDYIQLNTNNNALMNGHVSIERLSGPSAIAASETVSATYSISANQAVTALNPMNFDTRLYDTHGAVTTGASWKFTAPISGKYIIDSYIYITGTVSGYVRVYKNNVWIATHALYVSSSVESTSGITIPLNAGDFIDLRPSINTTFGGGTLGSNDLASTISISRIGN